MTVQTRSRRVRIVVLTAVFVIHLRLGVFVTTVQATIVRKVRRDKRFTRIQIDMALEALFVWA